MVHFLTRRQVVTALVGTAAIPSILSAQSSDIWSVGQAYEALIADQIRLIDVRSRAEWDETGVAEGAWTISLHEDRFPDRLFAARELADGRPVALTCATGGRSGSVMRSLRQAGYTGFIDVSEGMLGSSLGPGWIAAGLPIVDVETALAALPAGLV
ncbi:sulfurtransferase [Loktanella sp. 1ANDIMAR09]|jgi:rhodanese-related sulfurtransferase|uniref:rhodanese-like domain-containing protein n=1 Tax=Loktanella sp. 5RATIMAR09 TaxID=1225655 RepID=UPI0006DC1CD9|nr:rhodanese-like domain-containing protein [Loktanella sp. 5RATIMAR09]KQB95592.1 sulfurtransferase [Loktanella sp. 1ANDIMAR09]KQI70899.1 sulfurtransferase [Loktanella sp. 5RATIMAR09]